jgi:hypothetical protein
MSDVITNPVMLGRRKTTKIADGMFGNQQNGAGRKPPCSRPCISKAGNVSTGVSKTFRLAPPLIILDEIISTSILNWRSFKMKKVFNFKKSALAVAIVLASGYMGSAAAHWIPAAPATATTPTTPLGANNAYDVYHTSCFTATAAELLIPGPPDVASILPSHHLRVGVAGVAGTGLFKITAAANRGVYPGTQTQASCTDFNNANSLLLTLDKAYCNAAGGSLNGTVTLAAGNGAYDVVVSHPVGATTAQSAAGGYNAILHCEDAGNLHTKTTADGIIGDDYIQLINY